MSKYVTVSPEAVVDHLAIRELVAAACAHCTDRRDAKGHMVLFSADTRFVLYVNAKDATPTQELYPRDEALAPVFADLNSYEAAAHFIGQATICALTGNRAIPETYCLTHHTRTSYFPSQKD
jgi:hypothetical protein